VVEWTLGLLKDRKKRKCMYRRLTDRKVHEEVHVK
jgi:hypothetical protein